MRTFPWYATHGPSISNHFLSHEANPRSWRAWETDSAEVRAYAELDSAQSHRSGFLVVFLEWWLQHRWSPTMRTPVLTRTQGSCKQVIDSWG